MEAVNKDAFEGVSASIGLNVEYLTSKPLERGKTFPFHSAIFLHVKLHS